MTTRVLFLHGLEGGPHSSKAEHLRNRGYVVAAPQLPTRPELDVAGSLDVAARAVRDHAPDVVVGSSFGGGVACHLALHATWTGPLVLLAPAAFHFAPQGLPTRPGRVVVIHGRGDDVVPVTGSWTLALASQADVCVWLVDDDHRLAKTVAAGMLDDAIAFVTR